MEIKLSYQGKEVKFNSLEEFDRVTKKLLRQLNKEKRLLQRKRKGVPDDNMGAPDAE